MEYTCEYCWRFEYEGEEPEELEQLVTLPGRVEAGRYTVVNSKFLKGTYHKSCLDDYIAEIGAKKKKAQRVKSKPKIQAPDMVQHYPRAFKHEYGGMKVSVDPALPEGESYIMYVDSDNSA